MPGNTRIRAILAVATIVALVAVACSSAANPAANSENGTPSATSTAIRATATPPAPTSTPRPPLTDDDRLGLALMTRLFDFQRGPDLDVVRQMAELGHPGLVAPLVEVTGFAFDRRISESLGDALLRLTGEDLGGGFDSQSAWFDWLADSTGFEPIAGYDRWKGEFYSDIAGGLDSFLYEDVPTRIPLWGVQFGGVGKDGIPSLDDPIFTTPELATYLDPDERVFGLVVNGEARAYPERIMRVHELSNDVVGGRPVALVY